MDDQSLIAWQWEGYSLYHASRLNLLLHIVCVPLFLVANIAFVLALITGNPTAAIAAFVAMLVAFAWQGLGHSKEPQKSVPFRGPMDAVRRIFVEQWVTFPRFVLSGGWARAWREAA